MLTSGNLALKRKPKYNNLKLVCEQVSEIEPINIITTDNGGPIVFEAVLQDLGVNRNGRRYDGPSLKEALEEPHIKELIREGNWGGECGHPMDGKQGRQSNIIPDRVSHFIRKIWWVGDKLHAEIQTAPGKLGDLMKGYIKNGHNIAFSLRAMGSMENINGVNVVSSPMRVITYDWVILPSHMKAYKDKGSPIYAVKESLQMDDNMVCLTESFLGDFDDVEAQKIITEGRKEFNLLKDYYGEIYEGMYYDRSINKLILKDGPNEVVTHLENYFEASVGEFLSKK